MFLYQINMGVVTIVFAIYIYTLLCDFLFDLIPFSIYISGVFVIGFSMAYMFSPGFCHRFVGYLEEEAVTTYSKLIKVCINV